MGWVFSIALLILGAMEHDASLIITSGLFGIAGSIGFLATKFESKKSTTSAKEEKKES